MLLSLSRQLISSITSFSASLLYCRPRCSALSKYKYARSAHPNRLRPSPDIRHLEASGRRDHLSWFPTSQLPTAAAHYRSGRLSSWRLVSKRALILELDTFCGNGIISAWQFTVNMNYLNADVDPQTASFCQAHGAHLPSMFQPLYLW